VINIDVGQKIWETVMLMSYEGRTKSFANRYIRLKNFSKSIHQ